MAQLNWLLDLEDDGKELVLVVKVSDIVKLIEYAEYPDDLARQAHEIFGVSYPWLDAIRRRRRA